MSRTAARRLPILRAPVGALERALGRYTDRRAEAFDRRFGTETFERAKLDSIGLGPETTGYEWEGWGYGPIGEAFVHEIIRYLPRRPEDLVFIDVGAGKGKALLIAAEYPFVRVIGVELSDQLTSVARKNVDIYSRTRRMVAEVEVLCADFMGYDIANRPTVLFLNNPFPFAIADRAIAHIEEAARRNSLPIYVVYRKAPKDVSDRLDASEALAPVSATPYWRIYRSAQG